MLEINDRADCQNESRLNDAAFIDLEQSLPLMDCGEALSFELGEFLLKPSSLKRPSHRDLN